MRSGLITVSKGLLPLCQTRCMTAGPLPLPRLRLFSLSARVVKKSSDRKKMEFPRAKEEHPFREKLPTLRQSELFFTLRTMRCSILSSLTEVCVLQWQQSTQSTDEASWIHSKQQISQTFLNMLDHLTMK